MTYKLIMLCVAQDAPNFGGAGRQSTMLKSDMFNLMDSKEIVRTKSMIGAQKPQSKFSSALGAIKQQN